MPHPDLDRALDDQLVDEIAAADADELRDLRAVLDDVENQLSYVRRIAQGRLDIARSELAERRAGRSRSELSDVIRRLPDVFAGDEPASGIARHAPVGVDPDPAYCADLDAIVSPMRMLDVGSLSRRDLRAIIVALETYEAHVSVQRRIVQDRLSLVHRAIAQDYSVG